MARDLAERVADARRALRDAVDAWVATASASGRPHLVPLNVACDGATVLLATFADSVTARNLAATRRARLGVGDTRDVLVLDATAEVLPWEAADPARRAAFVAARGWDPADEPQAFVLAVLQLRRAQAWNSVEELEGRVVLADGRWLDGAD